MFAYRHEYYKIISLLLAQSNKKWREASFALKKPLSHIFAIVEEIERNEDLLKELACLKPIIAEEMHGIAKAVQIIIVSNVM